MIYLPISTITLGFQLFQECLQNQPETYADNGELDEDKTSYLISLSDGFLPLHHDTTFYIEPYRLHRFTR